MIYFTKYAEEKFDILNAHKVYIRKEEVIATMQNPTTTGKVAKLMSAERNGIKVLYQKTGDVQKVISFYPV